MINVKVDNVKNKKFTNFLWILFAIMISFTTSDLICGFTGNITLALIFSCLSGAVVIYGNLKTRKIELDENLDKIKKSFNNSNIIFTVLDIICSIIALLTGIVFIGLIFRAIWAIRITVIINKFRTVARILQIGSFAYLIKRRFYMKEFLKANKWSIISGFGIGGVLGVSSYFLMPLVFIFPLWASILISCGIGILSFVLVFFLGKEKVIQYALRIATKYLPTDKVKELTELANKVNEEINQVKEKEEAQKKLAEEKAKAQAIIDAYENAKRIIGK